MAGETLRANKRARIVKLIVQNWKKYGHVPLETRRAVNPTRLQQRAIQDRKLQISQAVSAFLLPIFNRQRLLGRRDAFKTVRRIILIGIYEQEGFVARYDYRAEFRADLFFLARCPLGCESSFSMGACLHTFVQLQTRGNRTMARYSVGDIIADRRTQGWLDWIWFFVQIALCLTCWPEKTTRFSFLFYYI